MSRVTMRKRLMHEASRADHQLPESNQYIVQVLLSVGNNLHMVTTPHGEVYKVTMPVKFRKNIWVKRGDYILVAPILEGNKVLAEIVKIMNKDSIKFYKENNIWPKEFVVNPTVQDKDNEEDLFENTNRNRIQHYSESSDSSESESSDEENYHVKH